MKHSRLIQYPVSSPLRSPKFKCLLSCSTTLTVYGGHLMLFTANYLPDAFKGGNILQQRKAPLWKFQPEQGPLLTGFAYVAIF